MIPRTLETLLETHHFSHRKMAFLAGPRQVGKTTLARGSLNAHGTPMLYYDWDDFRQRKRLLKDPYAFEQDVPVDARRPLVVFDEIHKYSQWKNYLKGVFDRYGQAMDFLVTGSGRLNIYKRGADSLFGRFFMYNLLPLSLGEIEHHSIPPGATLFEEFSGPKRSQRDAYESLLHCSGFPEPFLKASSSFLNRWENARKELVLRQDIRDLTSVREIGSVEHLMLLLPEKIGAPLSINSLCGDIGVSFKTIAHWMEILERVYYLFTVMPYAQKISRSIKKERKVYFWNWVEVEDASRRFENFVACHLQKLVTMTNDFGLAKLELRYCRDKDAREVDFLLLKEGKHWILVEAKMADSTPSPSLYRFMKALGLKKSFQVIDSPGAHFKRASPEGTVHVLSADIFLRDLP